MPDAHAPTATPAPPLRPAQRQALERSIAQVNTVLLGKAREVRLAFVSLLAGGLPALRASRIAPALQLKTL